MRHVRVAVLGIPIKTRVYAEFMQGRPTFTRWQPGSAVEASPRIERGILMKAMISALALGVSESAFGRMWSKLGALLDAVIPLALFVVIVVAMGAVYFGFVQ